MISMKDFKNDIVMISSTIKGILSSQQKPYIIVVEGHTDKELFSRFFNIKRKIDFIVASGKGNVLELYERFKDDKNFNYIFFSIDIDYDFIHGEHQLLDNKKFMLSVYCQNEKRLYFNDIENYLINTTVLQKLLEFYKVDCSAQDVLDLLFKLEVSSRCIGKYRAADTLVKKQFLLPDKCSVLNDISIVDYFDCTNFCISEINLKDDIPIRSHRKEHVEDLIQVADDLNQKYPEKWALSRGHDITKLLELYLCDRTGESITDKNIEYFLRNKCNETEFKQTPMYKKIANDILKIA